MALFPIINAEEKVQTGEKYRIRADKSFVSKQSTAISTLTIKPENDISAISVYDSDNDNWYLDWVFNDFEIDIDSTNNKINFNESGSDLTATISSATNTLSSLSTEIKTQLDSAGSLTYTVSYDVDDKITISATGNFELMTGTGTNKATSLLPTIGFPERFDGKDSGLKSSFTGKRTEYLTRKITLEAGDGSGTANAYYYVKVYSEGGDALFSTDQDIRPYATDIFQYIPDGKSTFNYMHREAQDIIISWLDEKGYVDVYGDKYTKSSIIDIEEFRQWSKFLALRLIYEDLSNAVNDKFMEKARRFMSLEMEHKNRAVVRVDIDRDGEIDTFEDVRIHSGSVIRK